MVTILRTITPIKIVKHHNSEPKKQVGFEKVIPVYRTNYNIIRKQTVESVKCGFSHTFISTIYVQYPEKYLTETINPISYSTVDFTFEIQNSGRNY